MPSAGDLLKKKRIAVLGSRSVGKSSLVVQFIENHFVEAYYPTIETNFSKSIKLNGVEYDCDIIDTAGQASPESRFHEDLPTNALFQDEYSILNAKHAIGIHGFVLVYSVASRNSFNMIDIIYDKIIDFCGVEDIPCVVVGSKSDLKSRQVQPNEGEELAKKHGAAWLETSAKNNVNVAKVFELCLGEIEKRSPSTSQSEPQKGGCIIM